MKKPIEGAGKALQHAKHLLGWQKALIAVASVTAGVVVTAAGTVGTLYLVGRNSLRSAAPTDMTNVQDDGTVIYEGETYVYNDKLTSVLVIGTDRERAEQASQVPGQNGQADALYLGVIDTETGKITVLGIARDIMTDVRVYSVGGQYVGTEKMQVCLSFAYGDGKHTSCENTVQAVSNLLYGADIGTYFCMDWADIGTLNDLVGGVEVPEYDDNYQPTGQMVTLSGDAVYKYLRSRDIEVLGSSVNRMDRQVNYLKAFAAKIAESARADITTPVRLFNELNNVSINTMDASKITYLTTVFLNGGAQIEFHELTGELVKGEEYAEMYLDDKTTYEMLLKLFYKKK